jgi:hypothetical protein
MAVVPQKEKYIVIKLASKRGKLHLTDKFKFKTLCGKKAGSETLNQLFDVFECSACYRLAMKAIKGEK